MEINLLMEFPRIICNSCQELATTIAFTSNEQTKLKPILEFDMHTIHKAAIRTFVDRFVLSSMHLFCLKKEFAHLWLRVFT